LLAPQSSSGQDRALGAAVVRPANCAACGADKTVLVDLRKARQARADAWIRWSRSPDLDDDFWRFHLAQSLDLLPPPGQLTVDVGCMTSMT
jgi:hypothetical protein